MSPNSFVFTWPEVEVSNFLNASWKVLFWDFLSSGLLLDTNFTTWDRNFTTWDTIVTAPNLIFKDLSFTEASLLAGHIAAGTKKGWIKTVEEWDRKINLGRELLYAPS